jgi:hypothetical protein
MKVVGESMGQVTWRKQFQGPALDDVFEGRKEIRLVERREKLHTAYINRRSYWQAQAARL